MIICGSKKNIAKWDNPYNNNRNRWFFWKKIQKQYSLCLNHVI